MTIAPGEASAMHIGHQTTTLRRGLSADVVIAVGAGGLAEDVFRHHPPSAFEVEQAIDRVEDALTASSLRHRERGDVLLDDPQLHALLGFDGARLRASRDEVEHLFAALTLPLPARPACLRDASIAGEVAARLLILRECLHHLGYQGVRPMTPATR